MNDVILVTLNFDESCYCNEIKLNKLDKYAFLLICVKLIIGAILCFSRYTPIPYPLIIFFQIRKVFFYRLG